MTITEFIDKHGITLEWLRCFSNPNMDADTNMFHYSIKLKNRARGEFCTFYSKGLGHVEKKFKRPAPPKLDEALDCLAGDSSSVECSFAYWCAECGYDIDSRSAERTYAACCEQADKLRQFLGDAVYRELIFNVDRL